MRFLLVKTGIGPAELCRALGKLDAVAVRRGAVASEEELLLAWRLAEKAIAAGKNMAKKPGYEFLLWLAGTGDINSAFRKLSPGEGEAEFFVVVFSPREKGEVLRELGAKELPPGLRKKGEALALERISLSRI